MKTQAISISAFIKIVYSVKYVIFRFVIDFKRDFPRGSELSIADFGKVLIKCKTNSKYNVFFHN